MARRRARRGYGQGTVEQATNGTWRIRWRENGQRRRASGFPTRDAAERVLAKALGEIAQERAGMPPDPRDFEPLRVHAAPWLDRRDATHRAANDDRCRWRLHLGPHFGHLRPAEVDAGNIRAFVEAKLRDGLNPATVGACVRLLSTFFTDLCERPRETGVATNPVRALPRSTRRLMRPTHDPKDTPFLAKMSDVAQVFRALPEPFNVAFAVGAFGGLRTGEVLALRWEHIDLDTGMLRVREQVQDSKLGPLKDDEARTVPLQAALLPVLKAWKLASGGEGLLFRPDRPGRRAGRGTGAPATFMRPHTLHARLRQALAKCALPASLTWYECTRHTFASQWVMANGSLEKLAAVLGHSSTEVTRRYAHLRPEHFRDADLRLLAVDLAHEGAEVVPLALRGAVGPRMTHDADAGGAAAGGFAK
jgi:integrase